MSQSDIPMGTVVIWPEKEKIPFGWIFKSKYVEYVGGNDWEKDNEFWRGPMILIMKMDNLTWIEYEAKKRNLI